jgi:hypothetical protein
MANSYKNLKVFYKNRRINKIAFWGNINELAIRRKNSEKKWAMCRYMQMEILPLLHG